MEASGLPGVSSTCWPRLGPRDRGALARAPWNAEGCLPLPSLLPCLGQTAFLHLRAEGNDLSNMHAWASLSHVKPRLAANGLGQGFSDTLCAQR